MPNSVIVFFPQKYLHLVVVVVGLAWLCDLESYVGGSLTTCRVTQDEKSKSTIQTRRDNLVL
jgi:hypothetical protein